MKVMLVTEEEADRVYGDLSFTSAVGDEVICRKTGEMKVLDSCEVKW